MKTISLILTILFFTGLFIFIEKLENDKKMLRQNALEFSKNFCSCADGLKYIIYKVNNFNFACDDDFSKGDNVDYDLEYYGKICKRE